MFVIEARTLTQRSNKPELFFVSDYVHIASSLDRAEEWMQIQHPGFKDRYCYVVVRVEVDSDRPFELIHYYDILGQQTTKQRCISNLL
jgi:hypothetical protein